MAQEFRPSDFLDFCGKLLEDSNALNEEALFRTVVNRCYIAAFMTAKRFLERNGMSEFKNNHEDYKLVEKYLSTFFPKKGHRLKHQMSGLRTARWKVDYNYPFANKPNDFLDRLYVDRNISLARHIISELEQSEN